jgi:cytochrome c oxidase subunit 1
VSSPPPIFNFDRIPTVVGGPYQYGTPGAVHGTFEPPGKEVAAKPAAVAASSGRS